MSRNLTAESSDEEALDWLRTFPSLAHLMQCFERAAPTARALLQMDSDASLTAIGIDSTIDRAELMLAIRRVRLTAATRGRRMLLDSPARGSVEMQDVPCLVHG